jgi:hypothetical protein
VEYAVVNAARRSPWSCSKAQGYLSHVWKSHGAQLRHQGAEIVGQHVKTHLRTYAGQRSAKEVRRAHPELESRSRSNSPMCCNATELLRT